MQVLSPQAIQTRELVVQSLQAVPMVLDERSHVERLAELTGRGELLERSGMDEIVAGFTSQFKLWPDPAVVSKFKYCANVVGRIVRVSRRDSRAITYAGDIPDFALDRLEKVREQDRTCPVTIHSNVPFPIDVRAPLRRIEPVMLAWPLSQEIYWYPQPVVLFPVRPCFVVAMWDMDKEILVG